MMTLRCTRKLLNHLPSPTIDDDAETTTILGDWYANLLSIRNRWVVLCISERTLIPVVIPARTFLTFVGRFREAVLLDLVAIGVPSATVEAEAHAMQAIDVGKTASRRVLGSLNDFAHECRWRLTESPDADLGVLSLQMARVPCAPLDYEYPSDATLKLFGAA